MPSVDALQIWEQLVESDDCREAVSYYDCRHGNISTSANVRKKKILEQGAADFDQKYCADDEGEKARYRTDYYVSGYMDMHLKQNLTAFRHCFGGEIPQDLLWVDFGCGPMTSGLALADILSTQIPDYKTHTAYFGIDASQNMVAKAKKINEEHELFKHFEVVQNVRFDAKQIPLTFPNSQIIVLCFSFVLAPDTLKQPQDIVKKLANDWKEYVENQPECRETKIIYLNPLSTYFHDNWKIFKSTMLTPNIIDGFCYTADDRYTKLSENCPGVYYYTIHGTRN